MPRLDDINPTDDEREMAETVIEAINGSDRLGIVPFFEKETGDRVLFLVAFRDKEGQDETAVHPIGPVYDVDAIQENFELPDEMTRE